MDQPKDNQAPMSAEEFERFLKGRSRYEKLKEFAPDVCALEYHEDGTPRKMLALSKLEGNQKRYVWERIKTEQPELAGFILSGEFQMMKELFGADMSIDQSWLDGFAEWLDQTGGNGPVIYPPNYQ